MALTEKIKSKDAFKNRLQFLGIIFFTLTLNFFTFQFFNLEDWLKEKQVLRQKKKLDFYTENNFLKKNHFLYFPALKSFSASLTWIQTVQSLYYPESYSQNESYTSWQIKKYLFLSSNEETRLLAGIIPLFLIGKDYQGAQEIFPLLHKRVHKGWKLPFWMASYCLDRSRDQACAAKYYALAAKQKGAPAYLGALSLRLTAGEKIHNGSWRKNYLESIEPSLLKKIKKTRPEWF